MPYLFMFLWLIFGIMFIITGAIWLFKKKQGKIPLISLGLSIICLVTGVVLMSNETIPTNRIEVINNETQLEEEHVTLKQQGLEFDQKSWEEFLLMYEAHNHLMTAISDFSNGNMSELDFYDYCKNAEKWFQQASMSFSYGETDDEVEYLSTFEVFAYSDQSAARNLMKYVDSNATADLSKAKENIERAKEAATIIAKNRTILLKKIGLTDDEIAEKSNQVITDLEAISN